MSKDFVLLNTLEKDSFDSKNKAVARPPKMNRSDADGSAIRAQQSKETIQHNAWNDNSTQPG